MAARLDLDYSAHLTTIVISSRCRHPSSSCNSTGARYHGRRVWGVSAIAAYSRRKGKEVAAARVSWVRDCQLGLCLESDADWLHLKVLNPTTQAHHIRGRTRCLARCAIVMSAIAPAQPAPRPRRRSSVHCR